jgi:hypothetical protein
MVCGIDAVDMVAFLEECREEPLAAGWLRWRLEWVTIGSGGILRYLLYGGPLRIATLVR